MNIFHRTPCEGWDNAFTKYVGPCFQHKRKFESAIPVIKNVTKVPDWRLPTDPLYNPSGITPVTWQGVEIDVPDCGALPSCESTQPPCGPYGYGSPPFAQSYQLTTDTKDYSKCHKLGFKNVQATRFWHGRFGFEQNGANNGDCPVNLGGDCGCTFEDYQSSANQVKYTSINVSATFQVGSYIERNYCGGESPVIDYELSYNGTVTVDPHSGIITLSGCNYFSSSNNDIIIGYRTAFENLIGEQVSVQCASQYDVTWNNIVTSSFCALPLTTEVYTHSDSSITHTFFNVENDDLTQWSITVTLGGANSAQSVRDDLYFLSSLWNFADDVQYPWRTDGFTSTAPKVTRKEVQRNVSPTVVMSCDFTDSNAGILDGSIMGAPSANGTDRNFDKLREVWWFCSDDGSCIGPQCAGAGWVAANGCWTGEETYEDPSGLYVPSTTTQFTNNSEARQLDPQAWYKQTANGAFQMQKWAEIIQPVNSFNFSRPCEIDRYMFKSENSRCVDSYDGSDGDYTITLHEDDDAFDLTSNNRFLVVNVADAVDGYYEISLADAGNPKVYHLSTLLWGMPSGSAAWRQHITNPSHDEGDSSYIGELRFPDAPAICSVLTVKSYQTGSLTNHGATLSFDKFHYLRVGDVIQATQIFTGSNAQSVVAVIDANTIKLDTDLYPYTEIQCPNSVSDYWNDTETKGDFVTVEWQFDQRATGEDSRMRTQDATCNSCSAATWTSDVLNANQFTYWSIPPEVSNFIVTQQCLNDKLPCCPAIVLCSPNNENMGPNSMNLNFAPTQLADDIYGVHWKMGIVQQELDPLWRTPKQPCSGLFPTEDGDILFVQQWAEDDGTCLADDGITQYFPTAPVVESMAKVPNGIRQLPDGFRFGYIDYSITNDPQPVPLRENVPPMNGGQPWTLYMSELGCVCEGGRFTEDYQDNNVSCVSDKVVEAP